MYDVSKGQAYYMKTGWLLLVSQCVMALHLSRQASGIF